MFGIGFGEAVLIAVIALLVVGPDKLPGLATRAGRLYHQLRHAGDEVRQAFRAGTKDIDTDLRTGNKILDESLRALTDSAGRSLRGIPSTGAPQSNPAATAQPQQPYSQPKTLVDLRRTQSRPLNTSKSASDDATG